VRKKTIELTAMWEEKKSPRRKRQTPQDAHRICSASITADAPSSLLSATQAPCFDECAQTGQGCCAQFQRAQCGADVKGRYCGFHRSLCRCHLLSVVQAKPPRGAQQAECSSAGREM
jgi:hypothetical protein